MHASSELPIAHPFDRLSIDTNDILASPDDADKRFIVDVDAEYSGHLDDAHSNYQLATEVFTVSESRISDYQPNLLNELGD